MEQNEEKVSKNIENTKFTSSFLVKLGLVLLFGICIMVIGYKVGYANGGVKICQQVGGYLVEGFKCVDINNHLIISEQLTSLPVLLP